MDPIARQSDLSLLHPSFRQSVTQLVAALKAEGLPLEPYETARTPERQVELWKRGRVTGYGPIGKTVTYDVAWTSRHQFGLAVDMVFKVGGKWTWAEPSKGMWKKYQDVAAKLGLQAARSRDGRILEWPHVQSPWPLVKLRAGEYPPGGDATWAAFLNASVSRWGSNPKRIGATEHPGAPPRVPEDDERPSLDDAAFLS